MTVFRVIVSTWYLYVYHVLMKSVEIAKDILYLANKMLRYKGVDTVGI